MEGRDSYGSAKIGIIDEDKSNDVERQVGSGSILNGRGFATSIFQSEFISNITTSKQINGQNKQCNWTKSAVKIEEGIAWITSTKFIGLREGALNVGAGAIVYIDQSTQIFGNTISQTNLKENPIQRNIICRGTSINKAQLHAESISFLINNSGIESRNKWILISNDSCKVFGSVSTSPSLLFVPIITKFIAKQMNRRTGIYIEINGQSLIRCQNIWLKIEEKITNTYIKPNSIIYLLENISTKWEDDHSIVAQVPEDLQIVQKGKSLQVQLLIGETSEAAELIQIEGGQQWTMVTQQLNLYEVALYLFLVFILQKIFRLLLSTVFIV
ncbi:MAG: hypothetical protein EZS28_015614 [Streblomastix strix]|uniref:Uncharacterized protein n=1 Tax=Streblomastix strix TaxID=222440 RepID=A0A5J4W2V7_9EUKA|nr:MAG: hypothetical protein EZS28_015614 [Streblomastix strix]